MGGGRYDIREIRHTSCYVATHDRNDGGRSPPELRLPRRRGVELSLLIGAVLISVYGYAAVGLAHDGAVPPVSPVTAPGSARSPCWPMWQSASAPRTPIRCCCRSPSYSTGWGWC